MEHEPTMNLSTNFTLADMTRNSKNLPNDPDAVQLAALTALCVDVLQKIRDHFGPTSVNSGFRNPEVNKAAGSTAKHSQHMDGEAADIHVNGHSCEEVLAWIVAECHAGRLPVDQVIGETRHGAPPFTWIHVSHRDPALGKANRGEFLQSFDGAHYAPLVLK